MRNKKWDGTYPTKTIKDLKDLLGRQHKPEEEENFTFSDSDGQPTAIKPKKTDIWKQLNLF